MGLEVYYPQDIRNALLAAEQAVNATADAAAIGGAIATGAPQVNIRQSAFTAGFLAGYRAALTTLALSFGLGLQRETSILPVERGDRRCRRETRSTL